jgi:hypothetical protein
MREQGSREITNPPSLLSELKEVSARAYFDTRKEELGDAVDEMKDLTRRNTPLGRLLLSRSHKAAQDGLSVESAYLLGVSDTAGLTRRFFQEQQLDEQFGGEELRITEEITTPQPEAI